MPLFRFSSFKQVAVAEKMLNSTWYTVENSETKQSLDRAVGGYTIDERIAGSIAAMFGVQGLPLPPKTALLTTGVEGTTPVKVTPAVIATAYGVAGVTPSGSATNIQAVAEFQGQNMIPANLKKFFAMFLPNAPASDSVVSKFEGDPDGTQEGIEADLDIQYIMGVAPGINTQFWEQKNT
jgi:tripeptidyl-peptidase-1